MVIIINYQIQP